MRASTHWRRLHIFVEQCTIIENVESHSEQSLLVLELRHNRDDTLAMAWFRSLTIYLCCSSSSGPEKNSILLAQAVPNFVCSGIKLLKALRKPRVRGSQETTLRSIKFLEHSVNLSECTRVMQIVHIYVCAHDVPPHCNVLVCSTIFNSSC